MSVICKSVVCANIYKQISGHNFIILSSGNLQIDSEKPKVGRRRHLKKHQMDSTDDDDDSPYKPAAKYDKDDDSSDKPAVKHDNDVDSLSKPSAKLNAPPVFNSCSEDEDLVLISTIGLGKKDSAKVAVEIKSSNEQTDDDSKKKSTNVQKKKRSAISEDPASPMYTSWFLQWPVSVYIILTSY